MAIPAELRHTVEALAVKAVVDPGPSSEEQFSAWIAALRSLQDSAGHAGADGIVTATAGALEALQNTPDFRNDLQTCLSRIQEALDNEGRAESPAATPLSQDKELLQDFVLESREHLASIESQTLTLERNPADSDALHAAFRGFHTIKGLAGFLEMGEVQHLAHEVETLLGLARNSQIRITSAAIDAVLQAADCLRGWLQYVESKLAGKPAAAPASDEQLIVRIRALATPGPPDCPGAAGVAEQPATPATVSPATTTVRPPEAMSVKVDTGKLDYLADMAGELVIAESLLRHDAELSSIESPALQRKIAQLARITAELQKTAMAMRLVPIGPLFRRMDRLVRDLSRQFGKTVEIETAGDEIELDRSIVDELADPLMHMVRNALDHGIEMPDDRRAAGKNPCARLSLKAQHQSGHVIVEIGDDGRGLNKERILSKAIEHGIVPAGRELPDSEIYSLIFEPGFTTAARVTNVSGRGVGMDVVRRHIEKLRGRIDIRSEEGRGASFLLKLPLTLAIIDGLIVGVGSERYVVPLFSVRELFRPAEGAIWTVQGRVEMVLVRGSLLPLVRLSQRFGIPARSNDALNSIVVVAEIEGKRFCLLVDAVAGKQEVVIKALGATFHDVAGIAGGTILGDGRIALILDLERLFQEKAA